MTLQWKIRATSMCLRGHVRNILGTVYVNCWSPCNANITIVIVKQNN